MKRILSVLLAAFVLMAALSACTGGDGDVSPSPDATPSPGGVTGAPDSPNNQGGPGKPALSGESSDMVKQLRSAYASAEPYDYTEPLYNLPRDFRFVLKGRFFTEDDWYANHNMEDVVQIYAGKNFNDSSAVIFNYDISDEDAGELTLSPWDPAFDLEEAAASGFTIRMKGENDWGNASKYYLVRYVDFETGAALDKPLVTLFTVKAELDAPQVKYRADDNGRGIFYWDAVPGATSYIVGQLYVEDGDARNTSFKQVDAVTEPEWRRFGNYVTTHRDTGVGELGRYSEWYMDSAAYQNYEMYNFGSSIMDDEGICVIAVKDGGNSNMSNIVAFPEFAPLTPYKPDDSADDNRSGDDGSLVLKYGGDRIWVPSVEAAPLYQSIEMMDGSVKQYLIEYPDSTAGVDTYTQTEFFGPDTTYDRIITSTYGTLFKNGIIIEDTGGRSMSDILRYLKEREQNASKGGAPESAPPINNTPSVDTDFGNHDSDVVIENETGHLPAPQVDYEIYDVTANSALSAYIALSFLNHAEEISLAEFPEAADGSVVIDAVGEAWLQNNAYIGGIDLFNVGYDFGTRTLYVPYAYTADEQKKLQSEIDAKAGQVVSEIITAGMSDYQKEEAINSYLCANGRYDFDALDIMMANETAGTYVTESTRAAQTAYGILVNGVGICQSYAEAFKALADKAGLRSVVASGVLNGMGGHAWNRVYVEGQWFTLDVTNNDSDDYYNEFFNMPDQIAAQFVTEDGMYALDSLLSQYTASDYGYDYFSQNGQSTDTRGLEDYLADHLSDGQSFDVVITDIADASPDQLIDAMQNAADRARVNFAPRMALWVLRVSCG